MANVLQLMKPEARFQKPLKTEKELIEKFNDLKKLHEESVRLIGPVSDYTKLISEKLVEESSDSRNKMWLENQKFSKDFFDLIVIDECHRGIAKEDSAWREILNYFNKATHIGLTATPKETKDVSNIEYFGEPIYTYSLKQGIDDGFLAPYRVIRVNLNVDVEGWRPDVGKKDKDGQEVEDRIYNRKDFDRNLVIDERTNIVAKKVTEFLKGYDRYAKTIVFCNDIDHAERMRTALISHNSDIAIQNDKLTDFYFSKIKNH